MLKQQTETKSASDQAVHNNNNSKANESNQQQNHQATTQQVFHPYLMKPVFFHPVQCVTSFFRPLSHLLLTNKWLVTALDVMTMAAVGLVEEERAALAEGVHSVRAEEAVIQIRNATLTQPKHSRSRKINFWKKTNIKKRSSLRTLLSLSHRPSSPVLFPCGCGCVADIERWHYLELWVRYRLFILMFSLTQPSGFFWHLSCLTKWPVWCMEVFGHL